MSLLKHSNEEFLHLNNRFENSGSPTEDSSDDEETLRCSRFKKAKSSCFIHNDLKGARKGGPNDENDKECECCGRKFNSKYFYLPLNFQSCSDQEDHPRMSLTCAQGLVCCKHPFNKKVDDLTEEELRDE